MFLGNSRHLFNSIGVSIYLWKDYLNLKAVQDLCGTSFCRDGRKAKIFVEVFLRFSAPPGIEDRCGRGRGAQSSFCSCCWSCPNGGGARVSVAIAVQSITSSSRGAAKPIRSRPASHACVSGIGRSRRFPQARRSRLRTPICRATLTRRHIVRAPARVRRHQRGYSRRELSPRWH